MLPPRKAVNLPEFEEDFVPVSSLNIETKNGTNFSNIDPSHEMPDKHVNPENENNKDFISGNSPDKAVLDDSLNHFQFTEVERDYRHLIGEVLPITKFVHDSHNTIESNVPEISHLDSVFNEAHKTPYTVKHSHNLNSSDENKDYCKRQTDLNVSNKDVILIDDKVSNSNLFCQSHSQSNVNHEIVEDSIRFDEILTPATCCNPQASETTNVEDTGTFENNLTLSHFKKSTIDLNMPEKLKSLSPKYLESHTHLSPKNDIQCFKNLENKNTTEVNMSLFQSNINKTFVNTQSFDCLHDIDSSNLLSPAKSAIVDCNFKLNIRDSESSCYTKSSDGSKSKVETLLEGILDKPSEVPLQRLLSEDFMELSSTVIQFSTASGLVVRTSQESLEKAKALLQDVLLKEELVENNNQSNCSIDYQNELDNSLPSGVSEMNKLSESSLKASHSAFQNCFIPNLKNIPVSNNEDTIVNKSIELNTSFIDKQSENSNMHFVSIKKNENTSIAENKTSQTKKHEFVSTNSIDKYFHQATVLEPFQLRVSFCNEGKLNSSEIDSQNNIFTKSKTNEESIVSFQKDKNLGATEVPKTHSVIECSELSENIKKHSNVVETFNILQAFSSAGGKNIKLSEAHLKKAKSLFSDLMEYPETDYFLRNNQVKVISSPNIASDEQEINKLNAVYNNKQDVGLNKEKNNLENEITKMVNNDANLCGSNVPIEEPVMNSNVERLRSPKNSHETFKNLSVGSLTTSEQENILSHNQSVFGDIEFSTEHFCVMEERLVKDEDQLNKESNEKEIIESLNKTPVWKISQQNLKLSSSKKLISLSTRSRRRNSPVENTTPKPFRKNISQTLQKKHKNEFQEKIKSMKFEEEAKQLLKSPEYDIRNSTGIEKNYAADCLSGSVKNLSDPEVHTTFDSNAFETPKSNKFLFKTANGTKVNITKESLRNAKKLFKNELESSFSQKEAEFIVKSPEYCFKSSTIPTEVAGNEIKIFKQNLEKKENLEKGELKIFTPKFENDVHMITTTIRQEYNIDENNSFFEYAKCVLHKKVECGNQSCIADRSNYNISKSSLNEVKDINEDSQWETHESDEHQLVSSLDPGFSRPLAQETLITPKNVANQLPSIKLREVTMPLHNVSSVVSFEGNNEPISESKTENVTEISHNLIVASETIDSRLDAQNKSKTTEKIKNDSEEMEFKSSKNNLNDIEGNKSFKEVSEKTFKKRGRVEPLEHNYLSESNDSSKTASLFTTARGSNVTISKNTFNRVKNIFNDLETIDNAIGVTELSYQKLETKINESDLKMIENVSSNYLKNYQNPMFLSASGHPIAVSEESVQKVKYIFKEDLKSLNNSNAIQTDSLIKNYKEVTDTNVKETNGRKEVSHEVYIELQGRSEADLFLSEVDLGTQNFMSFSSAGKTLLVNNDFNQVGNTCDSNQYYCRIKEESLPLKTNPELLLPGSSKVKNVTIAENHTVNNNEPINIGSYVKPIISGENNEQAMFKTAKGSNVKISRGSLQKVKKLFQEFEDLEIDPSSSALANSAVNIDKPNAFDLRSSIPLVIPTEKREFLNELLPKIKTELNSGTEKEHRHPEYSKSNVEATSIIIANDSNDSLYKNIKSNERMSDFNCKFPVMFSTAKGGNVHISEDTLKRVKNIFKDELNFNEQSTLMDKEATSFLLLPDKTSPDLNQYVKHNKKSTAQSYIEDSLTMANQSEINIPDDNFQPTKNSNPADNPSSSHKKELLKNDRPRSPLACGSVLKCSPVIRSKLKDELSIINHSPPINNRKPLRYGNAMYSSTSGFNEDISEKCLHKGHLLLKDELDTHIKDVKKDINEPSRDEVSLTVCESNVSFSNQSWKKERTELRDKSEVLVNSSILVHKQLLEQGDLVFPTVIGNNIISKESLQKEIDEKLTVSTNLSSVNVSDESLQKERVLYKNEWDTQITEFKIGNQEPSKCEKNIFSNSILSEESIQNDQFKDEVYIQRKESIPYKKELKKSVQFLLSTAGGNNVNVSERSLQKVWAQFKDELNIHPYDLFSLENNKTSLEKISPKTTRNEVDESDNDLQKQKNVGKSFPCNLTNSSNPSETTPKGSELSRESLLSHESLVYTPTFSGQFLNDELNRIEKLAGSAPQNLPQTGDKCCTENKIDSQSQGIDTFETPVLNKGKSKIRSGTSQKRLLYKSETCDPNTMFDDIQEKLSGKPYITSSTLVYDRNHIKPLMTWPTDCDSDDDILAAAETPVKINSNDNELADQSYFSEKRKPTDTLAEPINKKIKLINEKQNINFNEILKIRNMKREEQRLQISLKEQIRPSISHGFYVSIRNKEALMKFMEGPLNQPQNYSADELLAFGLFPDVIYVTSKNAVEFKFDAHFYFAEECFSENGCIQLGHGFSLILSDDNKVGLEEIAASFLANPDVDPTLCCMDWIKNHYRWIIWKLACLEKSFPRFLSRRFLVPVNVLHQLKYRYDREIDLVQRPAFRKILECDEPASRRFVACVADMRKVESEELVPPLELELTDGWYSIWSTIDSAMVSLIKKNKIKVGTKLIVQGAELLNCGDGCDPLEMKESVRLKLNTNSVRRTKWYTKMGFTKCCGPLRVRLDTVLPEGGSVGLTSAVISRVYPMLFISKDADGKSVTRNVQAESQFAAVYEREQNSKSEELFEKILLEVENKYKKPPMNKICLRNVKQILNPIILYSMVSQEPDIYASLSNDQLQLIKKYHEEVTSKIQEEVKTTLKEKMKELAPPRQVTALLKIRLCDPVSEYSALLSIWRPDEELCRLLSENRFLDFYNLSVTGMRNKVLQLTSTKLSRYKEKEWSSPKELHRFQRRLTDISELSTQTHFPLFGELDVVGIVIYIKEPEKPWGVTNVYLSDLKNNFLMITFWTSLKAFGCEELVKEGSIVAAINLNWRQGSGSYVVPSTFVNELTYFSSQTIQDHISQEITYLKDYFLKEDLRSFVESRKEALQSLLKERSIIGTPIRMRDSLGISPSIAKRIEKLKSYGPAPPLPKTPLISSPDIRKSFKSPRTNKTPLQSNN